MYYNTNYNIHSFMLDMQMCSNLYDAFVLYSIVDTSFTAESYLAQALCNLKY